MTEKLLPCPFCGGEAILESNKLRYGTIYSAYCQKCGAEIAGFSEHEAVAAWNRRVDARQFALKTRVCPMCEDCPDGCPVETPKDSRNIITNADRIRSLSDEELAEYIFDLGNGSEYCYGHCLYQSDDDLCEKHSARGLKHTGCIQGVIGWLTRAKMEVEL